MALTKKKSIVLKQVFLSSFREPNYLFSLLETIPPFVNPVPVVFSRKIFYNMFPNKLY